MQALRRRGHSSGWPSSPTAWFVSKTHSIYSQGVLAGWEEAPSLTSRGDKANCSHDSVFFLPCDSWQLCIPITGSNEFLFCLFFPLLLFSVFSLSLDILSRMPREWMCRAEAHKQGHRHCGACSMLDDQQTQCFHLHFRGSLRCSLPLCFNLPHCRAGT